MRNLDIVHAVAGALVLVSSALGAFVSPWWLLVSAFVGANLFQWAFSGLCPLERILKSIRREN